MDFDSIRKAEAARAKREADRAAPTRSGDPAAFARALDAAHQAPPADHADLAPLLAAIDDAAARFTSQWSPESLVEYKRVVKHFLEEFLARSHRRETLANFDAHATHDYVLLVRTIDEKLEALSRQFISQEGGQLQLLGLLDEIRGLLLDCVA